MGSKNLADISSIVRKACAKMSYSNREAQRANAMKCSVFLPGKLKPKVADTINCWWGDAEIGTGLVTTKVQMMSQTSR